MGAEFLKSETFGVVLNQGRETMFTMSDDGIVMLWKAQGTTLR